MFISLIILMLAHNAIIARSFSKEDHRIRYNRLQKYNTAISAVHGHNCPVHLSGKANETVYSIYMRIIMLCLYIMFTCIGYIIEYQKSTSLSACYTDKRSALITYMF